MEYSIKDIIEWLKAKASEVIDNRSLNKLYFDAALSLTKLDNELDQLALENVNTTESAD